MIIYGIADKNNNIHYVGATGQRPNLRFNWHVWAMRHPETRYHGPIHAWMATQDIKTLKMVVLEEFDDIADTGMFERAHTARLLAEGHPLKSTMKYTGGGVHKKPKLTKERKAALNRGRKTSKFRQGCGAADLVMRPQPSGPGTGKHFRMLSHYAVAHLLD